MSHRCAGILMAGRAAVVAATMGPATALAAATWTLQPGAPVSLTSDRFTTVLATGPGAASSAAATTATWTVRPGGPFTTTAGTTTLTDTTTGASLKCTSRMSGTLNSGSGLAGAGIGSITKAAYHCPTQIGVFLLTPRGLPWHLNLVSYGTATGVSRGTISHLQLALTGPSCRAAVNGTSGTTSDGVVAVTYTNQTGTLKISPDGGNLHWCHVAGCAGLVGNGDPAPLSASYTLSPPQLITSP